MGFALFWLPGGVYNFSEGNLWVTGPVSFAAFLWLSLPLVLTGLLYSFVSKVFDSYFIVAILYLACYSSLTYPFPLPLAMSLFWFPGIFAFGGELFGQVFLLFLTAIILSKKINPKQKLLLAFPLILPIGYGPTIGESKVVKIGIVQPAIKINRNISEKEKVKESLQRLYSLTSRILPAQPSLIIWPESSVPFHSTEQSGENYSVTFDALTGLFSQGSGNAILFNELLSNNSGGIHNSITLRQANGEKFHYYKQVLFPLGESLPPLISLFSNYFPMASNFTPGQSSLTFEIKGTPIVEINTEWQKSMAEVLTQPETLPSREVSKKSLLSILPLLCFEGALPKIAQKTFKAVQSKPQVIVNLVNDSWFQSNWQRKQHTLLTRMRAMELNRPLIRAALGGQTITFSPNGTTSMPAIPLNKPVATIVELQVPLQPENTIFSKYGDMVSLFFVSVFLLFLRYYTHEK